MFNSNTLLPLRGLTAKLLFTGVPLVASAQDAAVEASGKAVAPVHLDALRSGSIAATPWDFSPALFVLVALGIPALAWAGCAWKRALDEDPHRLRRRGRRELQRLLQQAGRQGAAPAATHLYGWQRASARTWGVAMAAPTPVQVSRALETHSADASQHSRWRELWGATERGLFAAGAKTPDDWLQRASTAAAEVRIPKRERWLPNRLRHWLPMLGVLCVIGLGATPSPVAAQATLAGEVLLPEAADLTETRAAAEQATQANWNDWAAHHNIAAYYMQQQRWNAAVVHGTISFLQKPSSQAGQDNLRFALTQVQTPDPTLRMLLTGHWYQRLATWLSAAQWQRLALGAALLLAAGLTAAVLGMYRRLPEQRGVTLAMRSGIVVGALLLAVSVQGWSTYGRLGDPRAAMLILQAEILPEPSDLAPREEASPAGAGAIVRQERRFLTWQQVKVRDDLTGWVRRDQLMPFYAEGSAL